MKIIDTKLSATYIDISYTNKSKIENLTLQKSPFVWLENGFMAMKFILISKYLYKSTDIFVCPKFFTCIPLVVQKLHLFLFHDFILESGVANSLRDKYYYYWQDPLYLKYAYNILFKKQWYKKNM